MEVVLGRSTLLRDFCRRQLRAAAEDAHALQASLTQAQRDAMAAHTAAQTARIAADDAQQQRDALQVQCDVL